MSEEKPRLSRREMREQGLLKIGREDTPVSRDDLLTRTSELQLRRPSRREMRLQREANEAKVAEQSAKFNPPADNATVESQPEKPVTEKQVHSFSFLNKVNDDAQAKEIPVQTNVVSEQKEDTPAEQKIEPAPTTGRSSVFDRFASKEDKAVSFRDRLVARTREGQREARENQTEPSVPSADVPQEQSGGLSGFFGLQPSEEEVAPQIDKTTVEELAPVVEDKAEDAVPVVAETVQESVSEEAPSVEVEEAPVPEPEPEPVLVPEPEPTPVSEPTPEDTADVAEEEDTKAEIAADKVEEKTSKRAVIERKDSVKDSTAVAEAGRYPTDVSMRLTDDDDEEKTGGDRLVSLLIILIGVLIGVVVGLIVQNFIFGAAGVDMNPAYYVQAVADSGAIGS